MAASSQPGMFGAVPTTQKRERRSSTRVSVWGDLRGDLPNCDFARIVEEARSLTGAHGAAIALRDEHGVLCRASTGNAPSVGLTLRPESGLAGECLRTGEPVCCDDMDNDPRVDRAIATSLQSRSALLLPIRGARPRDSTLGVIVVLSSRSSAFGREHVAILQEVAERVRFAWYAVDVPPLEAPVSISPQESVPGFASNPVVAPAKMLLESFPVCNKIKVAKETNLEKLDDSEPAVECRTAGDVTRRLLPPFVWKRNSSLINLIGGRMLVVGLLLSLAAGS